MVWLSPQNVGKDVVNIQFNNIFKFNKDTYNEMTKKNTTLQVNYCCCC